MDIDSWGTYPQILIQMVICFKHIYQNWLDFLPIFAEEDVFASSHIRSLHHKLNLGLLNYFGVFLLNAMRFMANNLPGFFFLDLRMVTYITIAILHMC